MQNKGCKTLLNDEVCMQCKVERSRKYTLSVRIWKPPRLAGTSACGGVYVPFQNLGFSTRIDDELPL